MENNMKNYIFDIETAPMKAPSSMLWYMDCIYTPETSLEKYWEPILDDLISNPNYWYLLIG